MLIQKSINFWGWIRLTYRHFLAIFLYTTVFVFIYYFLDLKWLSFPWQVLTVIGTAVSFYLGFKNNSAYDRMWEARKIWGAIVNSSRSWGIMVNTFINDLFQEDAKSDAETIKTIKKELIYRHIAWVFRLRRQLWQLKSWERSARRSQRFRDVFLDNFAPLDEEEELKQHLSEEEVKQLMLKKNICTQLINHQAKALENLRKQRLIDDFRHVEMQQMLVDLYTQQGKCERINNFPLPRQYSSFARVSVQLFNMLLPIGLVSLFDAIGPHYIWLTIPFSSLVGWIFIIFEQVGDITENPFQGLATDIPMTSLSRTIEIDLMELLDEDTVPPAIQAHNKVLM
ncbi:MAG: bestrophin family ion channel [Bacteroidota bacterium]